HDLHLRKKRRRDTLVAVIRPGIEGEPVGAGRDGFPFGQCVDASVAAGRASSDPAPLACLADLEYDAHADRRLTAGGIQDVGCNHFLILAGPHPRSAARTSLSLGLERRLSASGCMLAGPTSFTAPGPHRRRFDSGLPLAGTDFTLPQLRA